MPNVPPPPPPPPTEVEKIVQKIKETALSAPETYQDKYSTWYNSYEHLT